MYICIRVYMFHVLHVSSEWKSRNHALCQIFEYATHRSTSTGCFVGQAAEAIYVLDFVHALSGMSMQHSLQVRFSTSSLFSNRVCPLVMFSFALCAFACLIKDGFRHTGLLHVNPYRFLSQALRHLHLPLICVNLWVGLRAPLRLQVRIVSVDLRVTLTASSKASSGLVFASLFIKNCFFRDSGLQKSKKKYVPRKS